MAKIKKPIALLTFFFAGTVITSRALCAPVLTYTWKQLSDGIAYTTYAFPIGLIDNNDEESILHAFQVDPSKLRIDVVTASNEIEGSMASELAKKARAMLVINGGFFTPEHKSIGLIIKDGKELSSFHNTSWWSVFSVGGGGPKISAAKDFKRTEGLRMALQVGPRLVVDGRIQKLKASVALRSAVGITKEGKVIIAITHGQGISLEELAKRMSTSRANGGLECPNAMGLDGGGSSQLYAKMKNFELSLPGIARVTNGLAVFQLK